VRVVIFCHSILSCWNHGNAHFLRGLARQLICDRHEVTVQEPADGWSRTNLVREHGGGALARGRRVVPGADVRDYLAPTLDLDAALDKADVVLVHEWTDPQVIARIGARRIAGGRFRLLFHDTHHRAVTAPHQIDRFDLEGYDAILAFGEVLREVYLARGWGRRVFTWHEAADTSLFATSPGARQDSDLVWIGNWGDGERDRELRTFLMGPVRRCGISARVHGVRYPEEVRAMLAASGLRYRGWLPNHRVPDALARARVTVHIPRAPYVRALTGIPTIRMFEALACGIPLASAPWNDAEGLFPAGAYLTARDGDEMSRALSLLLRDRALALDVARTGLHAVRTRHTCRHRLDELYGILASLETARAGREPEGVRSRPEAVVS
jgi:spore maturation protein CgeB